MTTDLRVREIGEFVLIERLRAVVEPHHRAQTGLVIGIGDDAALWRPAPGHELVVTTDALVDTVHFRLEWTDWGSLGHKMLAVNISDIAAMGAQPKVATITLGLTGEERVDDIEALYVGATSLASAYGVALAGGDVVKSPGGLFLSVTVIGEAPEGKALRRSAAQPGDLIVVSGTLGASAAGLALLAEEIDPKTTGDLLIAAHLRPTPRVALGGMLFDAGTRCAMDLSDGLTSDLPKILAASGVSGVVDVDRVPVLPAVRALFPDRWRELALYGGEDYEILLTVPPARYRALHRKAEDVAATLTVIGHITETADVVGLELRDEGAPFQIDSEAFRRSGRVNVEDNLLGQ